MMWTNLPDYHIDHDARGIAKDFKGWYGFRGEDERMVEEWTGKVTRFSIQSSRSRSLASAMMIEYYAQETIL